ncbi:intermembrane lipid transfer protein VPS13 isoform X2 [Typha latifolia]|uniref:intermembrane lipid transfer protein VPS13 isoform X2 n=1 Tax=Typha latifolia TaxID=4733 RepID=UPI003C2FBDE5
MFEGVVSQVLAGYLGRYVKGIQKDQLKIGIWNEEILLENVELILEAFDYLQLPFALKTGRVGKLSIKIPWKKLGWDPIIVVLEDIFICACQREDKEWNLDSVDRRALAGKLAKLNAIELAKFSRRVSDNQTGQSFLSYISAKILDNIQVSIRNVHIIYLDSHEEQEMFIFGLRFSSLTIRTDARNQSFSASSVATKSRVGQVNKIIEISTVGFYCNQLEEGQKDFSIGDLTESQLCCSLKSDHNRDNYIINPFNLMVSVLVNKSGKLDGAPQYDIVVELTALVLSLNEIQLQQILYLWDYFTICSLRKKYGRYRPCQSSLSRKVEGWQRMWWHYAQESILAEVRQRLRKTSWSNLGRRLNYRRKYVNLYRRKLELLQKEQLVNKDILQELENMDKECDIDDILSYRSSAEQQLQELLFKSKSPTPVANDVISSQEMHPNEEQSSSRARRWLNWFSLGMLGAGGTADTSSFAGVISDEIIKDIYEATEFHPVPSFTGDSLVRDEVFSMSIRLDISQLHASISSRSYGREIAKAVFIGFGIECKVWEDSSTIIASINSINMVNPCNGNTILVSEKSVVEDCLQKHGPPFVNVQIDLPESSHLSRVSVKVVVQPCEATYESDFFFDLLQLYDMLSSFQFQHNRVLSSLNGLDNFEARLLSKAEYVSQSHRKICWDISLHHIFTRLPLQNEGLEALIMVLEVEDVSIVSRDETKNGSRIVESDYFPEDMASTCKNNFTDNLSPTYEYQDLYDHFDIVLTGLQLKLMMPNGHAVISIVDKFNASIVFGLCILLDEPKLKQLEVDCTVPFVAIHFSLTIYGAIIGVIGFLKRRAEPVKENVSNITKFDESRKPFSKFSVFLKLDELNLDVDLEDDAKKNLIVSLIVGDMGIRYTVHEFTEIWICMNIFKVDASNIKDEPKFNVLCFSRNIVDSKFRHVNIEHVSRGLPVITWTGSSSSDGCLQLHYQTQEVEQIVHHEYKLRLNDIDFHIHPQIYGMIQKFCNDLQSKHPLSDNHIQESLLLNKNVTDSEMADAKLPNFGFSNFCDDSQSGFPVDIFPFCYSKYSVLPSNFGGSVTYDLPDLRRLHVNHSGCSKMNSNAFNCAEKMNSALRSLPCNNKAYSSNNSSYFNMSLEMSINGVQAHFHDSSCILGTISVPSSVSSLSLQCTDCWDLLVSIQGIVLSSSWFPANIDEPLWGPSSQSNTSILNIRVRKEIFDSLYPSTEICIGIQNVCCILPSEFLAMVIGYFSLPDWASVGNEHDAHGSDKFEGSQDIRCGISFKFEIVESTLILPTESQNNCCLKLTLPLLFCKFVQFSSLADSVMDIPLECLISESSESDRVDMINVFGKSSSIFLLLLNDQPNFQLKLDKYRTLSLIENLDVDLWIRIPCKTPCEQAALPTSIMAKLESCNMIAEDVYFLVGLEAVGFILDQFSSVGKDSKMYESDVLRYLQLKRSMKDETTVSVEILNESIIRIKFCVKALSIIFSRLDKKDLASSETVANLQMALNLSVLLINEIPDSLDVDIFSLVLQSFNSCIKLASFPSGCSIPSHLSINFSRHANRGNEVSIVIPFLDVWLYLNDWNNLISLLSSYTRHADNTPCSSVGSPQALAHVLGSPASVCFPPEFIGKEDGNFSIRSENITVSFHVPIWEREGDNSECHMTEVPVLAQEDNSSHMSKHYRFLKFSFQSKQLEMCIGERYVNLKCQLDRLKIMLETIREQKDTSIPFIHIRQVKVGISSHGKQGELVHLFFEVLAESFDVGFSHQIFNFWSNTLLKFPEATYSSLPYHCLVLKLQLRKGSFLISDGRWSHHGPILETLVRNIFVHIEQINDTMEASALADLLVNYNNIDKVMWEPFIEPWSFHLNLKRNFIGNRMDISAHTDVYLKSTKQLNMNITEPFIEAVFRLCQMIKDSWNPSGDGLREDQSNLGFRNVDDIQTRRYAPYILSNETSLPFRFRVFRGPVNSDDMGSFSVIDENTVPAGYSVPIYVEETLDEFFFQHRGTRSSEQLAEKRLNSVAHHMISIQFDGTSGSSKPMSMDLVGVYFFEINFSRSKQPDFIEIEREYVASSSNRKTDGSYKRGWNDGLVVPVVFEVSMQNYSKMIRLYSTVILLNTTSMPLELRFDIPFGVSSKVLGPIYPGQKIALPLHLSEAGRIRWHPVGTDYLWSEAHSLSSLLSQENRLGFMRSFVCYPFHPSGDPFRCCISIQDYSLSSSGSAEKSLRHYAHGYGKPTIKRDSRRGFEQKVTKKHFIRHVRLTTPFLVKNYLPTSLSLTIDGCGVANSVSLSEMATASIFLVDSSHDLGITFHIQGYSSILSKFPRAEQFSVAAKLNVSKFSITEKLAFYSDASSCPLNVTLEKSMDAYCGARELCLSVPFLLYNCTNRLLTIIESNQERTRSSLTIPSSYNIIGGERHLAGKDGLALLSLGCFPSKISSAGSVIGQHSSYSSKKVGNGNVADEGACRVANAHMYAPSGYVPTTELLVKLSASLPERSENTRSPNWSSPFSLVPTSGSTNVVIPEPCHSGAFLISATSVPVSGELSGRTRVITFQPRYVICNACSKDLFYRQKGTSNFHRLGAGKHSHLHWSDTTRELLVSIRFDGRGWLWSGSFLPDCLGDAQVKMRNYVSGESNMVRVEIQNADLATSNEKIINRTNGSSTAQLILLSDDKTGFMPYRIDNFTMERLRIYQQRCESIETIVYPYTSCQYAWDEPCYPHRLVIEVPGERILGMYSLDDVYEYMNVLLPSTSEKPERRLGVFVHAEGAIKVLSIADSRYHTLKDMKEIGFLGFKERNDIDQKQDHHVNFSEVITLHLPFIGISLISSYPQELLFVCAKEASIVATQSLDQQKISFQILSLQIDNQFSDTPYPILLSFDNEVGRSLNFLRSKENKLRLQSDNLNHYASDSTSRPVIHIAATRWRTRDTQLVSYKYIKIGVAPLCIELEERAVMSLLEFFRATSSRIHDRRSEKDVESQTWNFRTNALKDWQRNSKGFKSMSGGCDFMEEQSDSQFLPSVVPAGAPWQQIYLLARRQEKIYVETFELSPIKLSLSFTSTPWMNRSEVGSDIDTNYQSSSTAIQRGLMALVDVEGVQVHLGELMMENLMASWRSVQEILAKHYTRQLLHELYKVFGSAGVIGNPMGFARNVGIGLKDFVSASSRGVLQSPAELLTGIAQGSKTLLSSTIYAMSSATTQFSKTAHKGIVAFTFDEQAVSEMDEQKKHHGKGVLNGFLEGLTGLLQSPIRGAEKHGLPGVVSGIAMGTAGLVARPVASILEATGKTAQSIRNRSNPHHFNRFRVRFPRPLARELPLMPYSWEEAIGVTMLLQADGQRLKDETFVMCKTLKLAGKFVILSERLLLVVWCPYLVDLGTANFVGVPSDPAWVIETEMNLESVVHIDRSEEMVNIVGSNAETLFKHKRGGSRNRPWSPPTSSPLFHTIVELPNVEEAVDALQVILSMIEKGRMRRAGYL